MKKIALVFLSFLWLTITLAQIPTNYYTTAEGKTQNELKITLSDIITNGYIQRTYNQLWNDFYTTNARPNGKVWDMYSNCEFTFGTYQCGNYSKICDCYNREHSIPKSWFNDQYPMYTDLFHLYPTDGFTNGKRGNFPLGEVSNASWTSNNNSKLGLSSFYGFSGVVFEPADEYKGDFARTHFYMATRYINKKISYENGEIVFTYQNSTCDLTDYAINLFLKWHREDPVSEKETHRNNAVFTLQKNRNPYIDYPELVEHIWGNLQTNPFSLAVSPISKQPEISIISHPNGIGIKGITPNLSITIYSILGHPIFTSSYIPDELIPLTHLCKGVYIIKIGEYANKIIW
jgi:endonuclease I